VALTHFKIKVGKGYSPACQAVAYQKVEHRVRHLAVLRAESKFPIRARENLVRIFLN
jgi:hypothetical protein